MSPNAHVLSVPFVPSAPLFANSGAATTFSRTALIFVEEARVLKAALKSTEFRIGRRLFVYFEKLDSSGAAASRGLARAAVVQRIDELKRAPGFDQISIHVFARAQPQYLFPESASNKDKRILTDAQLVSWWAKTLHIACKDAATYFAFVPGEDAMSVARRCGPVFKFGFGFGCGSTIATAPPSAEDDISEAVITSTSAASTPLRLEELVPRFPDDAKTKALSLLKLEKNASLMDLMTMLETTGECRGSIAGFFGVYFNETSDGTPPEHTTTADLSKDGTCYVQEFMDFERLLMKQNFSSSEKTIESSRILMEAMSNFKYMSYKSSPIQLPDCSMSPVALAASEGHNSTQQPSSYYPTSSVTANPALPSVNSLQGLIKKKKRVAEKSEVGLASEVASNTKKVKL
ncbi:histone acetylation protein-domain-containing protein [Obelidium mucronatum]|nr:histone acetylation protein-domain-containing protein [Obelidium mucronatum]